MYTPGFKGKRYYKRNGSSYTKKTTNGNNYNSRLKKLESELRGVKQKTNQIEYKFADEEKNDSVVLSGGEVQNQIFVVPTGDTDQSRDGKKITITSIFIRFQFTLPSNLSFGDTFDTLRVILLIDKQANGALPAVSQILESPDIQGFRNLDETHRFRTLLDRTWNVVSKSGAFNGSVTHFGGDIINYQFYKKLNLPILYNDDSGLIATITSNNIVMMFISNSQLGGIKSNIRIRYLDS